MKKFITILIDIIAFVICISGFIAFIINTFIKPDFNFSIFSFIVFAVCFIYFIFSKHKRNAFVDIWNVLEIIFDLF